MNTFRIAQDQYANDLSGKGAALFGGRWNSIGVPLLYTAFHQSLCVLEHLVHLPQGATLDGYSLITLEIPDSASFQEISLDELTDEWRNQPPSQATKTVGNQFFAQCTHLGLKVPSVIIPAEFNLLLNPFHPHFSLVRVVSVVPFLHDYRLLK